MNIRQSLVLRIPATTVLVLLWATGASHALMASEVTITIMGTVSSGSNGNYDGQGTIFGDLYSLAGQPFTLTYTFDDTKGQDTVSYSYPGGPATKSDYTGTGASSPGNAVLQIGSVAYAFPPSTSSEATRWAGAVRNGGAAFDVYVQDAVNDSAVTSLYYVTSPTISLNYSWDASFADSSVACCVYAFNISIKTANGYNFASGSLIPASIREVGTAAPCSSGSVSLWHGVATSPQNFAFMVAQFSPHSSTLPNYEAACGFDYLNWQQQITTDPGGGSGTHVQPNDPGPLIASGNVVYNDGVLTIVATSSNGLCISNWSGCSLVAPPSYYDPPFGGYKASDFNPYPFYYPYPSDFFIPGGTETTGCTVIITILDEALCPPFPYVVSLDNTTLSFEDAPSRESLPAGGFLALTTTLVGVSSQSSPGSVSCGPMSGLYCTPLYSWQWTSTFDDETGAGGVTLTNINGVQLPHLVATNRLATTASELVPIPSRGEEQTLFEGTVNIKNIGNSAIDGPFQILFTAMPANVSLNDARSGFDHPSARAIKSDGPTIGNLFGTPYVTISTPSGLSPGQSTSVYVEFKNLPNHAIGLVPVVYSGSIIQ